MFIFTPLLLFATTCVPLLRAMDQKSNMIFEKINEQMKADKLLDIVNFSTQQGSDNQDQNIAEDVLQLLQKSFESREEKNNKDKLVLLNHFTGLEVKEHNNVFVVSNKLVFDQKVLAEKYRCEAGPLTFKEYQLIYTQLHKIADGYFKELRNVNGVQAIPLAYYRCKKNKVEVMRTGVALVHLADGKLAGVAALVVEVLL